MNPISGNFFNSKFVSIKMTLVNNKQKYSNTSYRNSLQNVLFSNTSISHRIFDSVIQWGLCETSILIEAQYKLVVIKMTPDNPQ